MLQKQYCEYHLLSLVVKKSIDLDQSEYDKKLYLKNICHYHNKSLIIIKENFLTKFTLFKTAITIMIFLESHKFHHIN